MFFLEDPGDEVPSVDLNSIPDPSDDDLSDLRSPTPALDDMMKQVAEDATKVEEQVAEQTEAQPAESTTDVAEEAAKDAETEAGKEETAVEGEEVKTAEEPKVEEPKATETPEAPVEPPKYTSFDDVKLDALPEPVRVHVAAVMELARPAVAEAQATVAAARDVRARFEEYVSLLETAETPAAKVAALSTALQKEGERADAAAHVVGELSYKVFAAQHPEVAKAPPHVREHFSKLLASGAHATMGDGALHDRLGAVWEYTRFQTKWSPEEQAPAATPAATPTVTPAAPKVTAADKVAAPKAKHDSATIAKQAALSNGSRSTTVRNVVSPKDRDPKQILDEHDHLLDDFRTVGTR